MNISAVEQETRVLLEQGHRVFQIHRFANSDFEHVARLQRWAEFPYQGSIIDLGSGTGEVSLIFSQIRKDLNFTLVNVSQFQLDCSPDFKKHKCSFLSVPEEANSFDGAMFNFSIGHEDHFHGLSEAFRLLKQGGVLFIYDMVGANKNIHALDYFVSSRESLELIAKAVGFTLDFYMEPCDNSDYGEKVIGDDFVKYFSGTKPAIWRFIK